MAEQTGIEWCDATFNPWWGCEKVSPACAHCYADTLSKRYANGVQLWGAGHEFRFFGDKHWAEPLKWARLLPAKLGRRPRIFTASMADVFEDHPALVEPRERLLQLIIDTPELDWLLLTKRPEVMRDRYYAGGWPLTENLWLGTSIENARFTWRANVLREIPAAVRFISAEPLLGSLFVDAGAQHPRSPRKSLDLNGIEWVIVGGESGPKARRTDPDWIQELLAFSALYERQPAMFVKQLGVVLARDLSCGDRKGGDQSEWPRWMRLRQFPASGDAGMSERATRPPRYKVGRAFPPPIFRERTRDG